MFGYLVGVIQPSDLCVCPPMHRFWFDSWNFDPAIINNEIWRNEWLKWKIWIRNRYQDIWLFMMVLRFHIVSAVWDIGRSGFYFRVCVMNWPRNIMQDTVQQESYIFNNRGSFLWTQRTQKQKNFIFNITRSLTTIGLMFLFYICGSWNRCIRMCNYESRF